jgi:hypothetical protein
MAKVTYYYDSDSGGDSGSDSDSVIIIGSPDKQTAYSTKDGSVVRQYSEHFTNMLRQTSPSTPPKNKKKEKQTTSKTLPIDIPIKIDNHEKSPNDYSEIIQMELEIWIEYRVDIDLVVEITTVGSIIESAL